jgi:uncharacterized protein
MKFELYNDINKFTNEVMDIVAVQELQNSLIISNSLRGQGGADTSNWLMATVKDDKGSIRLVAMMTPPFNLVIYEVNNIENEVAIELFIKELENRKTQIPGVLAEKSLAGRFAIKYSSLTKTDLKDGKKMRIYRLDEVQKVGNSSGKLRLALEQDLYYLPYWHMAFSSDCGLGGPDVSSALEKVRNSLNEKKLFIWEDSIPVSQAAMGRKTLNGAIVNAVYTPPHYWGNGYATSCVASLSRHLLDSSFKFCSLFTDLANPVSNSIYMKIGYKPLCDYDEYKFMEVLE